MFAASEGPIREVWRWIVESPFGTATWTDWLDVGVLTLLVYGALGVLRGTRASQILVGLLLVGVVYLLSAWTGLAALHWVLDNLFVYAVLAMLILFQEDIRQVLATAGGTLFARATRLQVEEAQRLEEITKAVFNLAGRRIGALIAIERSASLEPYCENAHPIDGIVSNEVLQALFHPSSPLHDGAVVIARGRLAHAAAFFPISLSKQLPKAYGTRHRAAIGITERTDAVCLLVSEERGTVAVVAGGTVVPVVDNNDLRQRLQEALGAPLARTEEVAPG